MGWPVWNELAVPHQQKSPPLEGFVPPWWGRVGWEFEACGSLRLLPRPLAVPMSRGAWLSPQCPARDPASLTRDRPPTPLRTSWDLLCRVSMILLWAKQWDRTS